MKNEVEVMENVAETAAHTGLTRNQKVGIIVVGATVLTGGLAYLGYRLFKGIKARKAAKPKATKRSKQEEVHD